MSNPRTRKSLFVAGLVTSTIVGVAGIITGPAAAGAGAASADPNPASPTLSDVHVHDGTVSALLTFPAVGSRAQLDAGSLRASLGPGTAQPVTVTPVVRERRAAMLVVDTSGSMAGAGLAAAKSAGRSFLAQVPDDVAVGLESFAARPRLLVPPTRNRGRVEAALDHLQARGGTALYDALRTATHGLGRSGSRTLVLLSDGGDTNSRTSLAAALYAVRSTDVRTVAVGFQTDTSQYAVLDRVARAGHGTLTRAHDPGALRRAFGSAARQIATQVRVMAKVPAGMGGGQQFSVTGTVNGQPFSTRTAVALPKATTASANSAARSAGAPHAVASGVALSLWIGAGAVFLGLLVLVLIACAPAFTGAARQRIRTLDRYVGTAAASHDAHARQAGQELTGTLLRAGDAWARSRTQSTLTGLLLERADLPLRLNEWYVLRAAFTVLAMTLGWVFLHGSLTGSIVGLALGLAVAVLLPSALLRFLAKRRARKFEVQLPDVLTLVASSLSTGFSLPQALDGIVRDAAEPAAKEFARALAETRIGAELEGTLERTATRMNSVNLAWATMAIRVQRSVGGNLSETLRTTAHTLRERESLRRQVRALSAEGRLSMWVLLAVPVVMATYLFFVNRTYLALLWQRPLGLGMLGLGAVLLTVGFLWMRKVVEVKV